MDLVTMNTLLSIVFYICDPLMVIISMASHKKKRWEEENKTFFLLCQKISKKISLTIGSKHSQVHIKMPQYTKTIFVFVKRLKVVAK